MALNELRIIVVDGGSSATSKTNSTNSKKKNVEPDAQDPKESKLYKALHFSDSVKTKIENKTTPTQFYALQAGASIASQTIKSIANYYLSDIGRSNGDSNYQAQVNRTLEVVGDVTGVVGGAFSGAAAGSMFGPVGAVIGFAAGAISSSISLAFKYAEKERAYQHEMFKENTSQAYNLARANYSVWTGRAR